MVPTMSSTKAALDPSLAAYRSQFPILESSTYLNSNSMGAMPRAVPDALMAYCESWEREGVEAWEGWIHVHDETADLAGRFFGAGPGETVLGPNVAYFQSVVASCFDFTQRRNKVVIESLMFPNVNYVWERHRELGVDLHLVPSDDGMTIPTERILEAIDENTRLVSISHAVYVSGALQDVKAISKRAHEVGALVLLDAYQTVGCLPFSVYDLGVDMLVAGSHKWLCGGPGTGFFWAHPKLRDTLHPRIVGWWGHASPFAFEPAPIRMANSPWRFMAGTPTIPAYYIARAAYKILLEVGVEKIRAHNLALARVLIDRAQAAGLVVHSPTEDAHRTGFVAIDFPGSEEASHALIEERFKLDWRPNCGLRMGPHFYTTEEEVHRVMDRTIELAKR